MAKLLLLGEGGVPKHEWEVRERPLAVGRGTSADVQVEDAGLSRRHFMISPEGEAYVLRDLSSRNGTWVAGERTTLAKLRHNDLIVAGKTSFRFSEPRLQPDAGPHGTEILSCV